MDTTVCLVVLRNVLLPALSQSANEVAHTLNSTLKLAVKSVVRTTPFVSWNTKML
jgi:hypothetical protein